MRCEVTCYPRCKAAIQRETVDGDQPIRSRM